MREYCPNKYVSVATAPIPSFLQETGALISQGATTLAPGTYSLLTQLSSLTPLLAAPLALASLIWSGSVVVATTVAPLAGLQVGDIFITTIAGATPTKVTTAPSYAPSRAPAPSRTRSRSIPGLKRSPALSLPAIRVSCRLWRLPISRKAWGNRCTCSSWARSTMSPAHRSCKPSSRQTPDFSTPYLVPRGWDASTGLLALIAANEALTAKVNFFITTTLATYTTYTNLMTAAFVMLEAPNLPITEFSCAAAFQHSLAYAPTSSNRMTPFAFSFVFGVTPYPVAGNNALFVTLKAAHINIVGTGAEGGISDAIILWGTMMDGNDFTYWYSVDWIQINADLVISNAIINGSNNPLSPLYYNQFGINTLQDAVVQLVQNAITYGLANGTVARAALDGPVFQAALNAGSYIDQDVVNAVPFILYTTENPNAYGEGLYGGLSVVYIPQRGFTQIVFNIQVTDFLTQ